MNNDKYKTLLDKYFEGNTTKEEEVVLKSASENNENEKLFFEALKEEKQAQMNWSFEDFMKKTENQPQILPLSSQKRNTWVWMAASMIFLIGFGVFLMKNPVTTEAEQPKIAYSPKAEAELETETKIKTEDYPTKPETQLEDKMTSQGNLVKETQQFVKTKERVLPQATTTKIKQEEQPIYIADRPTIEPEEEYESSFVIINGKKIENEETAISLTENAFKLFASNVSSSINQAEVLHNLYMEF